MLAEDSVLINEFFLYLLCKLYFQWFYNLIYYFTQLQNLLRYGNLFTEVTHDARVFMFTLKIVYLV